MKKGSPITGLESLNKDTKVLTVKGSTSAQNIREKAPEAVILEFENYQDAFTALKAGQGDALTTDNSILLGMRTRALSWSAATLRMNPTAWPSKRESGVRENRQRAVEGAEG